MKYVKILVLFLMSATVWLSAMQQSGINTPQYQLQLLEAIQNNNIPTVQRLLQAGLNPNFELVNRNLVYGKNPLATALLVSLNPEIIRLLLQHGADPNTIVGYRDASPALIYLAQSTPTTYILGLPYEQQSQSKITSMLLADPCFEINKKNVSGWNASIAALYYKTI